jgi:hypothetical protein
MSVLKSDGTARDRRIGMAIERVRQEMRRLAALSDPKAPGRPPSGSPPHHRPPENDGLRPSPFSTRKERTMEGRASPLPIDRAGRSPSGHRQLETHCL